METACRVTILYSTCDSRGVCFLKIRETSLNTAHFPPISSAHYCSFFSYIHLPLWKWFSRQTSASLKVLWFYNATKPVCHFNRSCWTHKTFLCLNWWYQYSFVDEISQIHIPCRWVSSYFEKCMQLSIEMVSYISGVWSDTTNALHLKPYKSVGRSHIWSNVSTFPLWPFAVLQFQLFHISLIPFIFKYVYRLCIIKSSFLYTRSPIFRSRSIVYSWWTHSPIAGKLSDSTMSGRE